MDSLHRRSSDPTCSGPLRADPRLFTLAMLRRYTLRVRREPSFHRPQPRHIGKILPAVMAWLSNLEVRP